MRKKSNSQNEKNNAEYNRLKEDAGKTKHWKKWGSYLSEREWGTVREDYSPTGDAWKYITYDEARSHAYRWNEDGIAGLTDKKQYLCFALSVWNGKDPFIKERLYGFSGPEGNHGEDVKEYYYYLDNTPTHSYMKYLYKYPQNEFPYQLLQDENNKKGKGDPEYELIDTGIFDENEYFDINVEYAKVDADDILIKITAKNQGQETASLHLLPTLWFRNIWSWTKDHPRPLLYKVDDDERDPRSVIKAEHPKLGNYWFTMEKQDDGPELLFTENETNYERLFPNAKNKSPFVKDGINEYLVHGDQNAVNAENKGTKVALRYFWNIQPGEERTVKLRLSSKKPSKTVLDQSFDSIFKKRIKEANGFYDAINEKEIPEDLKHIQRQAFAGLLWNKQFYHYNVRKWLLGDPTQPEPPQERLSGRNHRWMHLDNSDVISMPDTWEYPWYASWDLAFHCIPLSLIDPEFAKEQLLLFLREWYMHPNGQLPAYEWGFDDADPPVHAWAALRVFRIERRITGKGDYQFLERVFHKLLINFTWWVNRKDAEDRNVFQGGFLGLDNIGVFNRSEQLPIDGYLDQSDGTSWMAMYCLNMLAIALELARQDKTYEDVATKFLEHFFYISHAMNDRPTARGDDGIDLWDDEDNFYYDIIHFNNGDSKYLKIRSIVGLIPLFAVETIEDDLLNLLPGFKERLEWFLNNRPDICTNIASVTRPGRENRRLLSVVNVERLEKILERTLDENEFLSTYGIRSLSRYHKEHPYKMTLNGNNHSIHYEPAESRSGIYGGNSNWRGPVWFPINYLLIEAIQKFDYYYGDHFKIECPTNSGNKMNLWEISTDLSRRLIRIFLKDKNDKRVVFGENDHFQNDPDFTDHLLFYEYFHGDKGYGLGASHQTGWTGLIAKLIQQSGSTLDI